MKNGLMSSDLVRFPVPVVNWEINPTPFWLIRVWIACLSPDRILWVRFLCVIVFIVFLVWVVRILQRAIVGEPVCVVFLVSCLTRLYIPLRHIYEHLLLLVFQ